MITATAIEQLLVLRDRLFIAIGQEIARGGTSKSYEGLFEIQLSRYGEQESVVLVLHCYAIGPGRHHAWRGLTLDDCVRLADEDVTAWIREAADEAAEEIH